MTLGYGLGDGEIAIRFQAVAEICLLKSTQTHMEAHPTSYPIAPEATSQRVNRSGHEAVSPPLHTSLWCRGISDMGTNLPFS